MDKLTRCTVLLSSDKTKISWHEMKLGGDSVSCKNLAKPNRPHFEFMVQCNMLFLHNVPLLVPWGITSIKHGQRKNMESLIALLKLAPNKSLFVWTGWHLLRWHNLELCESRMKKEPQVSTKVCLTRKDVSLLKKLLAIVCNYFCMYNFSAGSLKPPQTCFQSMMTFVCCFIRYTSTE